MSEKMIPLDRELEHMLISAVRYAIGRKTYIVNDTILFVNQLMPSLSNWCKRSMLNDIKSELERRSDLTGDNAFIGDYRDHELWLKFKAALESDHKRE